MTNKPIMKRFIMPFTLLLLMMPATIYGKSKLSFEYWETRRNVMVEEQIIARDIDDPRIIEVMSSIPRHLFVPPESAKLAYEDYPVRIGYEQTISQPYIVAYMTEAVQLTSEDKVLEIGTGSGYQAAVLAEIVKEVYSIEIIKELAVQARKTLDELKYTNIHIKHGDGYQGWKRHAPYDVIIVTAAPKEVPHKLVDQLAIGGRMIIPIGSFNQELYLITKTREGIHTKPLLPVRFVPMVKDHIRFSM